MSRGKAARQRFDWAVIRIVPRVHREEFSNAGVLLHVPTEEWLGCRILPASHPLLRAPKGDELHSHLLAVEALCHGDPAAGPIARMSTSERFHWLTAPRSAIVQCSPVRVGLTCDPESTLISLFEEQCC